MNEALGQYVPVLALIEFAAGIAAAREIATHAHRLAFGSIDFAADVGYSHTRDALLLARLELVIASRSAGKPQPIDGVTTNIRDDATVEDDARYAASLGFGGKLLIHPAQVAAARRGLAPSDDDVSWARKIIDAASGSGAIAVDGAMVDAPVLARAHNILQRRQPRTKCTTMIKVTEILADYVANLQFQDLPVEVPERARQLLTDLAGSIVRAGKRIRFHPLGAGNAEDAEPGSPR